MSNFFDFDASLPPERPHNQRAPGFGPQFDAFAGFNDTSGQGDGEILNFEETYDGLGEQLDDVDDALNDDTFGGSAAHETRQDAGRDFHFSGKGSNERESRPTAPAQPAMQYQQAPQQAPQYRQPSPPRRAVGPAATGYEQYQKPGHIPRLEASASIWGTPTAQAKPEPTPQHLSAQLSSARHMMSLEEVEAAMRAQKQQKPAMSYPQMGGNIPGHPQQDMQESPMPPQPHLQYHSQPQAQPHSQQPQSRQHGFIPPGLEQASPQMMHRQDSGHVAQQLPGRESQESFQPRQILQNPYRAQQPQSQTVSKTVELPAPTNTATLHNRGVSHSGKVVTNPEQLLRLSGEERAAFLEEDARRAKRNHKIHLLSKHNGLMTPQDKNFITRIQLQQLVTAIGNVDEHGPEAALAEDFYYQVFSQIRGAPRQDPNNHFARTYLHHTGGRGAGSRRYPRGGDHMRRMEQQVQRAVEAAKSKPKNKQLVIEGSLGKISFSNAKTPKPLLNLKRPEVTDPRPTSGKKATDPIATRRIVLRDIEDVYNTLLNMEDHERKMPPQPKEESSADEIQAHMDWRTRIQELNGQLWSQLKVLDPIVPNSPTLHPFIAILSHPKGKKLIPRVFRQIDDQQRVTIITMIVVQLDSLDVIRFAQPPMTAEPLPLDIRNEIDLFSQAVMPSVFGYVSDAAIGIIIGLLGLILDRVHIPSVLRAKIGISLLTMFISRAELVKQGGHAAQEDLEQWSTAYNRLFDAIEPHLGQMFPGPIESADDMYVWQFLAAIGINADQEQQQRLVIAVKERVMETVTHAKALPDASGKPLLDNVNLFMRAIGLDVELLS